MRAIVAMAVVLATVATALTGVRQHSETRRLEYRVWDAMRRRDALTRQVRELQTEIEEILAPRRLLEEQDRRREAERAAAALSSTVVELPFGGDGAAEGEEP